MGWSNVRHYLSQQQVCRAADVCLECGWADMKEMSPSTTCDHAGFISGGCWALKTILKPIRRQCSLWKQEKKKKPFMTRSEKKTLVLLQRFEDQVVCTLFFFFMPWTWHKDATVTTEAPGRKHCTSCGREKNCLGILSAFLLQVRWDDWYKSHKYGATTRTG